MTLPSTHINSWILTPVKDSGLETYYLKQEQAEGISRVWKNSPNAEMRDINGNLKALVNRNDYRLREYTPYQGDNRVRRWLCAYGTRHNMAEQCECKEKFGCRSCELLQWCQKHYKISFSHQITYTMQKEFIKLNQKHDE